MKNGKYSKNHGLNLRPIVLVLAVVLLVGATIGGTIAWLTDTTDEVENTFTVGNINITLEETKEDFKMIPGWTIDKDPVVTVKANSEDCWVFIKVDEAGKATIGNTTYGFNDFITYAIDKNWTPLTDKDNDGKADDGVYYCYAKDITADRPIKVLGYMDGENFVNNKVLVKDTVTKEMMDAITTTTAANPSELPKLTFTAYAVQLYKSNGVEFTAAEAWAKVAPKTADDNAGDAQG